MQEMRIYLLNNTKPYREGEEEYSGAWFNCPVDFEEVREKIGVEHEEQIEIADYELPFDLHSDRNLSTTRTRYATMMWVTVQLWQNTLSVKNMFLVRFLTNC